MIVGHQSGNESVNLNGQYLWLVGPFTAPADGQLGSVTFRFFSPGQITARYAIYADNGGAPGALLAATDPASVTGGSGGAGAEVPLPINLTVAAGQAIWLAMLQSAQAFVYYEAGLPKSIVWKAESSLPAAPSGLNTFSTSAACHAFATYGAGALQSGAVSLTADSDAIHLSSVDPFGGTPPYSFEWHRSAVSGFSPCSSTLIGTTQNFDDATLGLGYYKLRTLDSDSGSVVSNQLAGQRLGPALKIGAIGDSFYAGSGLSPGQNIAARCAHYLGLLTGRSVTLDNRGVGGSRTTDWLPTGPLLAPAATAFATGGVELVNLMLGANDAIHPHRTPAAVYASNLAAICTYLLANVPTLTKIILHHPTYIPPETATDETAVALTHEYRSVIDSLAGGNIEVGDTLSPALIANNCRAGTPDNLLADDRIHLNATGADWAGFLQASV